MHAYKHAEASEKNMEKLIADVAVTKCHQRLNKILIYFYPHFIEELSKVVFKKIVSCNTPMKLNAIIFA